MPEALVIGRKVGQVREDVFEGLDERRLPQRYVQALRGLLGLTLGTRLGKIVEHHHEAEQRDRYRQVPQRLLADQPSAALRRGVCVREHG